MLGGRGDVAFGLCSGEAAAGFCRPRQLGGELEAAGDLRPRPVGPPERGIPSASQSQDILGLVKMVPFASPSPSPIAA